MGVAPVWKISLLIKVSSDLGLPCRGPQRHLRHQSAPRVRSKDTAPFWPKPRSPRLVPLARACPGQGLGRGRAQGPRAWRPILPLPLPLPQANLWAGTHGQETFPHHPWGPQGAGAVLSGGVGVASPRAIGRTRRQCPALERAARPGWLRRFRGSCSAGPGRGLRGSLSAACRFFFLGWCPVSPRPREGSGGKEGSPVSRKPAEPAKGAPGRRARPPLVGLLHCWPTLIG